MFGPVDVSFVCNALDKGVTLTVVPSLSKRQRHEVHLGIFRTAVSSHRVSAPLRSLLVCWIVQRLVQLQQIDDFHWLLVSWVHQRVAALIAKLSVDFDVWIQAQNASASVEVIGWQGPFV
jgi:hypothetical protein